MKKAIIIWLEILFDGFMIWRTKGWWCGWIIFCTICRPRLCDRFIKAIYWRIRIWWTVKSIARKKGYKFKIHTFEISEDNDNG